MSRVIFQCEQWIPEEFPQERGTDEGNPLEIDDSGAALIAHFSGLEDEDAGMFARIQSWNEGIWSITDDRPYLFEDLVKAHPDFCSMLGHNVRVTVEVLD